MSPNPFTVAIAGSTGLSGVWITKAFLSHAYFPHVVKHVVAFTRNASSQLAEDLKAAGAEVRQITLPTPQDFQDVDVYVNALTTEADWDAWVKAAIDGGIRIYFPSELGFDHYTNQNQGEVFARKRLHSKLAEDYSGGKVKVIRLPVASFLNYGNVEYAKSVGFDYCGNNYTVFGNRHARLTYNHLRDIGASIVRLSVLAAEDPSSVPDVVRIAGDTKSIPEIAAIVGKRLGYEPNVVVVDPSEVKQSAQWDLVTTLRLLFSSGEGDFSQSNHNELVNPGEKYWKWTTVESWMAEKDGNLPLAAL